MGILTDIEQWTLERIAERCSQETDQFYREGDSDARYCYELFRRAIVERCERAWELVYAQYTPLIERWVRRHPAFPTSREEVAYLTHRAIQKMWAAVDPKKFKRFPNLKSVLRYLQMCVHSVILDEVRAAEKPGTLAMDRLAGVRAMADPADTEDRALDAIEQQRLWQALRARMHDDKEYIALYGSFVLGLVPRQLLVHYREVFRDVREIYRIKENVLARLRRDASLRELFGQDA